MSSNDALDHEMFTARAQLLTAQCNLIGMEIKRIAERHGIRIFGAMMVDPTLTLASGFMGSQPELQHLAAEFQRRIVDAVVGMPELIDPGNEAAVALRIASAANALNNALKAAAELGMELSVSVDKVSPAPGVAGLPAWRITAVQLPQDGRTLQ